MGNCLHCAEHKSREQVVGRRCQPSPSDSTTKATVKAEADEELQAQLLLDALDDDSSDDDDGYPTLQVASHALNSGLNAVGTPWDHHLLGAPVAPNEEYRLLTYRAMGLQDTAPCPELDTLLSALCTIMSAPLASLALYTDGRCWLTNTVQMPQGEMVWNVAACPWNLLVAQPQTLVCGDLQQDARFSNQPWTLGGLRCYCSAPLLASNGHRLGTVCFMDTVPREVDAGMCRVLNNFGELAVRVLERHVGLAQKLRAARLALPRHLELLSSLAASHDPSALDLMQGQLQPPGPEFGYWKPTPITSRPSSCASSTPRAKPAPLPAPEDSQLAREITFALTQPSPASSMSHPASNLSKIPPPPRLPPLLQLGNSHCPGTSSESCLNTSSEATTSLASRPPDCSQGHSSAASAAVRVAPSIETSPSLTTTTTITQGPAQLPASSKCAGTEAAGDTLRSLSSPQPSSVQHGQQAATQAQPAGQLPSPSLAGEPDQAASRLAAKAAAAPPTTHSQPSPPPPTPLALPPGPASAPEGGLASAPAPAPASPPPLQAANPLQGTVNNSPLGSLTVAAPLVEVLRGHRGCGISWHSPSNLPSASSSSKRSNLGPATASQPPKDTAEKAVTDVVHEAGGKEGAGEVPEDMLVMNAFWRQLRSQENTFEACVLLVDTAKPGWPVVFADDTWRLWAGFGRDAIVGQPLASCVAPAAPTAAPPAWAALQAEAQKGRRFLIPSMVATPVGPAAAFADITTVRKGNGQPGATSTPHDLDQGPRLQGQGAEQVHPQRLRAESAPAPTVLQQAAGVPPSSTAAAGVPDAGGAAVKAGQGVDVPSAGCQQQAAPAPCGVDTRPGTRRGSSLEGPPGSLPQASPLVVPLATANLRPIPPCTTDLLHSELRDALEASLQQQQEQKRRESAQPLGSANSSMSKRQQLQARSKGSKGQGAGLEGRRSGASGQSGGTSQHRLTIQGFPTSITYTPSAAQARGSSRVFDMSFRPAALDLLDADTLPLGMPSFVPMTVNSLVAGLYAVRLHNPARLALPSRVLKPSAKVTALQDAVPVKLAPQFFPGLVLTQVLGAGGYGTAYHGVWHDAEVVLKVQDLTLRTPQQLEEAQLEVCLGQLLQHPNLVRSLAHGAAQLPLKPDAPPTVLASTDTQPPSQLETEQATPLEAGAPAIAAVGAKGSREGKPACMSRAAARPRGSSGSKAAGGRGDRLQQQAVAGRGAGLLGHKPQKPSSPDWFTWELGSSSSSSSSGGSEDSRSASGDDDGADKTEQEEEEEEEEETGGFNEHEDPAYWFSKYAAGVPHLPRLLSSMSSAQGSQQPSSSSHTQSAWTSSLLGTEHHGSTSSARLHSQGCSLSTANTHSSSSAARQQPHPQPQPQPTAQLTGTIDPHRGTAGPQAHPNTPTQSVAQQGTGMGTTPAQPNPAPRPVLKLDPEPSEHPPTAVGLAQHVQPGDEQSADTHASPQPDVSASLPPTAEGSVVASSNMSSIPTWTTYVPTAAHPVPSPSLVEPSSHAAPDPAPHPPTPHPPSPHPLSQQATGLAPGTSTSQPPTPSSAAAPSTSDPIKAPSAVGGAHSSLLPKSSAKAVQAATAISASSIDSSALQQRLTPPWSLAQSLGINSFASDKKGRGQEEGHSGARGPRAAAQASTFAKLVATWRGAGKQGLGPPSTLSPTLDATLAAAPAGPGKGTPTHAPDPAGKQAQPAAPAMGLGQAGQGQARHVAVQQTGQNAAGAVAQPTQGQGGARRASQKPMHMAEELAALRRLTESVEFPGGLGRQAVPLSSSVNSRGSPGARVDLASQDLQLPARLRIFMLMEFCDAGSLQDAVDRGWLRVEHGNARTPLHAARSMAVITDIACGLGYLHVRGVVHADLSASNILLCKRAPCMLSSRPELVTSGLGRLPAAAVPKPGGVADTAPKSGGSGVAAATGSALDTAAAEGETTCEAGTWAGAGALVLGAMPHAPTTTDRAPATAEHARPASAAACLPDPSAIAAAALPPPGGAAAAPVPQQALAAMRTQAAAGPGPGPGLVTQTATLSHQGSLAAPSTPVVAQGVVAITLPRAKSGKPGQPARLASTAALEAATANEESKGISLLPPAQRYVVTDAGQVESTEVQYVAKISDFGKSRVLNPEGVIEVGSYATVTHMAPEVLRDRRLSPAADVYSFGVLCWQIITGLRPWGGMSHRQIFGLVSSGQGRLKWPQLPPSLPDRGLWVALQALATACMAPDVSARPSMRVVRKHLKLLTAKYVGEK